MRISVEEACARLLNGEVVAVPTETVYGLAARLHSREAIEHVFKLKNRPADNPLIIHIATAQELKSFTMSSVPHVDQLIQTFWPGPLTLVLPIENTKIPDIARANLSTAAFRLPNHPIAQAIASRVGPLVAPSANLSGHPSATIPEHVEEDFGSDFPVVNGGACEGGVESTILVFFEGYWHIGRLGILPPEVFSEVLGYQPEPLDMKKEKEASIVCPGQYYRHYAPLCRLILGYQGYDGQSCAVVGYHDRSYPQANEVLFLGSSTDPDEVSHNLYKILRLLDEKKIPEAWVDLNVPRLGLWRTVIERLSRAAL